MNDSHISDNAGRIVTLSPRSFSHDAMITEGPNNSNRFEGRVKESRSSHSDVHQDPESSMTSALTQAMRNITRKYSPDCSFSRLSDKRLRRPDRSRSDTTSACMSRIEAVHADDTEEKVRFLTRELAKAQELIQVHRDEKYLWTSRVEAAEEKRIRSVVAESEQDKKQVAILSSELQVLRQEYRELLRTNESLRSRCTVAKNSEAVSSKEIESLKSRLRVLRVKNLKQSERVSSTPVSGRTHPTEPSPSPQASRPSSPLRRSAELRVRELELSLAESEQRCSQHKESELRYSQELESARTKASECSVSLSLASMRCTELEGKILSLEAECVSLRRDLVDATRRAITPQPMESITSFATQLAAASARFAAAEQERDTLSTEREKLQIRLSIAYQRERSLLHELNDTRTLIEKAAAHSQGGDMGLLSARNDGSRTYMKKIRTMQKTINDLNDQINLLELRELKRAPVLVRCSRCKGSTSSVENDGVSRNSSRSMLSGEGRGKLDDVSEDEPRHARPSPILDRPPKPSLHDTIGPTLNEN